MTTCSSRWVASVADVGVRARRVGMDKHWGTCLMVIPVCCTSYPPYTTSLLRLVMQQHIELTRDRRVDRSIAIMIDRASCGRTP